MIKKERLEEILFFKPFFFDFTDKVLVLEFDQFQLVATLTGYDQFISI